MNGGVIKEKLEKNGFYKPIYKEKESEDDGSIYYKKISSKKGLPEIDEESVSENDLSDDEKKGYY